MLPRRNPLCDRTFSETAREAQSSPELGSRPRILGLRPLIKVTPIKCDPLDKRRINACSENHRDPPRVKIPAPSLFYEIRRCLGAMPRSTYCQLRICLTALTRPETRQPIRANPPFRLTLNTKNTKSARRLETRAISMRLEYHRHSEVRGVTSD
jgi:hypothetical protein